MNNPDKEAQDFNNCQGEWSHETQEEFEKHLQRLNWTLYQPFSYVQKEKYRY